MKPNPKELYVIEQLIEGKWYYFVAKDTEEDAKSLAARFNAKTTDIFRVRKFQETESLEKEWKNLFHTYDILNKYKKLKRKVMEMNETT